MNKGVLNISHSFLVARVIFKIYVCTPACSLPQQSFSSGVLLPEMMESETPPPISPPNRAEDPEVSCRRISPDQQAVQGTMKTKPDDTSTIQGIGCAVPTGTNNRGPGLSILQPETTHRSSKHIPLKVFRTPSAALRDPEMPDTLTDTLQHAPVSEEHRTLMGTVVRRILSVKSGLNEAFMSMLRGFEVHNVIFSIVLETQNAPVYRQ